MTKSIDREGIIDKIKALFERTIEHGCTEAEAIAAALAAQRLIVRYDVTDDELSERRPSEDITEVWAKPVCTSWSATLAGTIAAAFRCRVAVTRAGRRKRYSFFGYEADAAAARLAFERLHEVGGRLATEEVRRWRHRYPGYSLKGVKSSYCTGFVRGVADALERQTKALMVVVPEEVDALYEMATEGYGDYVIRADVTYRSAFNRGRNDGREAAQARSLGGQRGICA